MRDLHAEGLVPRVRLLFGRDWFNYRAWQIGVEWDLDPDPQQGNHIYRKRFVFRVFLDKR